jgi:hypothetical protein
VSGRATVKWCWASQAQPNLRLRRSWPSGATRRAHCQGWARDVQQLRLPTRARRAQGDRAGAGESAPLSVVCQGRRRRLLPVDRSRLPETTACPSFQGRRLPGAARAHHRLVPGGTRQRIADRFAELAALRQPLPRRCRSLSARPSAGLRACPLHGRHPLVGAETGRASARCSPSSASGWRTSGGCASRRPSRSTAANAASPGAARACCAVHCA